MSTAAEVGAGRPDSGDRFATAVAFSREYARQWHGTTLTLCIIFHRDDSRAGLSVLAASLYFEC